jgi:hypothetical protein
MLINARESVLTRLIKFMKYRYQPYLRKDGANTVMGLLMIIHLNSYELR